MSNIPNGNTTGLPSKMRGDYPVEFDHGARRDCSMRPQWRSLSHALPSEHSSRRLEECCESDQKRLRRASNEKRLKCASPTHALWGIGTSGPRSADLDWR